MDWLTKYDLHSGLAGKMAQTLGVDFDEKLQRGELRPEDLRTAVQRCMGCEDPVGCAKWLDEHAGGADQTPDFCCNKARLEGLR